ncbi:transmembrane protein 234 homolog isoform X1 [Onthophagus taurus]|uniref:transmembrane protein 234 homolog isoform X1 n=1 Tax=Onthophagus taurus TaxID=166361 RepID=UPI0039BEB1AE
MFGVVASLILVALLWGATNPLIKRGSKDIVKIKESSKIKQFILELKYLFTNIHYIVPMALNQLGSILYFFTLQNAEISMAVPVTNSLSFVVTAITGVILGENKPKKETIVGMLLILIGTFLCCYDKYIVKMNENAIKIK